MKDCVFFSSCYLTKFHCINCLARIQHYNLTNIIYPILLLLLVIVCLNNRGFGLFNKYSNFAQIDNTKRKIFLLKLLVILSIIKEIACMHNVHQFVFIISWVEVKVLVYILIVSSVLKNFNDWEIFANLIRLIRSIN